jgi:hypothetical protein
MMLKDGELVQWQRSDKAWQRGRVIVMPNGNPISHMLNNARCFLVRHGLSNDLEFVPSSELQVQLEEHPA